MKRIRFFILLLLLVIAGGGCKEKGKHAPASLPTRGKLTIGIDESLRPFASAEIAVFSVYYPGARITPRYLPEKQVIEKLLANDFQTVIICRDLHPAERAFIKNEYHHLARSFKLAEDEIVAVVNRSNPLLTISRHDIEAILSGKIRNWKRLAPSFPSPITVVTTESSSIDRFFSSAALPLSPVSTHALDTTGEVIAYVKQNASAIGVVGGSWFRQKGDKYPDVKPLAYAGGDSKTGNPQKPFTRPVYAVTHEPFTGLGTGFISFMASQKGQLILSKAGMTPYKPIDREIEILDSFKASH